jgi:hypothetical protein
MSGPLHVGSGSDSDLGARLSLVRSSLYNGHAGAAASCPFGADFVAKVGCNGLAVGSRRFNAQALTLFTQL